MVDEEILEFLFGYKFFECSNEEEGVVCLDFMLLVCLEEDLYKIIVVIDFGIIFSGYVYVFILNKDNIYINCNWG